MHLDVARIAGNTITVACSSSAENDELHVALMSRRIDLIGLENEGSYEVGVGCALLGAGYALANVYPRQAREFAKAIGGIWPKPTDMMQCPVRAESGQRRCYAHRRRAGPGETDQPKSAGKFGRAA